MYRTPKKQRAAYVYTSATGAKVTLQPGIDGVTEADIAALHRADDDEWNNENQQHRSGRVTVTEIVSLDDVDPDSAWVSDGNADPLMAALSAENIRIVRDAIAQLPDKQAKAVTAVWLDGIPAREYAALTGTGESNVSHLIRSAIKNLGKIIKQ